MYSPRAVTGSTSDTGGLVGGTVGANFQTGEFVFGVEGDWDYSAINTGTTGAVCARSVLAKLGTIGWPLRAGE